MFSDPYLYRLVGKKSAQGATRIKLTRLVATLGLLLAAARSSAEDLANADVVVVVDTSTSMAEPGMDPDRTSLLVTQLLADIVPGELAVVRLLDVAADSDVLPSRTTGERVPCTDDPSRLCALVEADSDWYADAREKKLGALPRPRRGDASYKSRLEDHLRQEVNNSDFGLALRAAQGVFDDHEELESPRTVIWLSDGRSENEPAVRDAVREIQREGVALEAIVFGSGETRLVESLALEVRKVSSPADLMAAFADAFRTVVQAPYRLGGTVAVQPRFEIRRNVDEAWIVVYGDDSLSAAGLTAPGDRLVETDHAAGSWPGAGAYRVAYLRRPEAGTWTVHAEGGGRVAYAVVQRSALQPAFLGPSEVISGTEVTLEAGARAGLDGDLLTDPEVLSDTTLSVGFQGQTYTLSDRGDAGDVTAGDGRFSARARFRGSDPVEVTLRLTSPVADRSVAVTVEVRGTFRYTGEPVVVDLGALKAGETSCRQLSLAAERQGETPLELRAVRPAPARHALSVRLPAGVLAPDGAALPSASTDPVEVCLAADRRATSSRAEGEQWLELRLAGSDDPSHGVPIALRCTLRQLTFWELWGRLILALLGVLTATFIVGGFVWPHRFQRSLALAFAPGLQELEEQSPQPVAQWRGVGIGFYRHARAFLHPDYRISGNAGGAVASLRAAKNATWVQPRGPSLARQTLDGDWEPVGPAGRRARPGDVYRVGEQGPCFRITSQGGRR